MALDPEIAVELQSEHRRLRAAGELLSDTQLDIHYATFAARFGPDSLQATDGEALLELLHGRGEATTASFTGWSSKTMRSFRARCSAGSGVAAR